MRAMDLQAFRTGPKLAGLAALICPVIVAIAFWHGTAQAQCGTDPTLFSKKSASGASSVSASTSQPGPTQRVKLTSLGAFNTSATQPQFAGARYRVSPITSGSLTIELSYPYEVPASTMGFFSTAFSPNPALAPVGTAVTGTFTGIPSGGKVWIIGCGRIE